MRDNLVKALYGLEEIPDHVHIGFKKGGELKIPTKSIKEDHVEITEEISKSWQENNPEMSDRIPLEKIESISLTRDLVKSKVPIKRPPIPRPDKEIYPLSIQRIIYRKNSFLDEIVREKPPVEQTSCSKASEDFYVQEQMNGNLPEGVRGYKIMWMRASRLG